MKYPAMPRCCRFFTSTRREEDAYPSRSGGITDEQRRRGEKATESGGRGRFGLAGGVACSLQVTLDMLVGSRLAFQPKASSRDMAEYVIRLLK